jgi:hypothetical protein
VRRLAFLGVVMAALAILFMGSAHADDYAGGTPPNSGSVAPSNHAFVDTPPNGQGTQVLGIQFTRTANGLAVTGADIAELVGIAVAAAAAGTVVVRRSRPRSQPPAAS